MSPLIVRYNEQNRNIFEKCKMKRVIIFVQSPKIRRFISLQRKFPKITQKVLNISMTGTDHYYSKLSITLEENLRENQRKSYISDVV